MKLGYAYEFYIELNQAGTASKPADRALEQAGRALEPAGRPSELAGRASDPAGTAILTAM